MAVPAVVALPEVLVATTRTLALAQAFTTAAGEAAKLGASATAHLKGVKETVDHLKTAVDGLAKGFEGVADALLKISKASSDAHTSLQIAANTAHNLGEGFDPAKMERWLESVSRSAKGGGFALDELRSSFVQLVDAGVKPKEAQRLLGTTVGMAVSKRESLGDSTKAMVAAVSGDTDALKPYGANTTDKSGKPASLNAMVGDVDKQNAGNAAIQAESLNGALTRLHSTANHLLESALGKPLEGMFTALANVATHVLENVDKLPGVFSKLWTVAGFLFPQLHGLAELFHAVWDGVVNMGRGIVAAWQLITGYMNLKAQEFSAISHVFLYYLSSIGALLAMVAEPINYLSKHWDQLGNVIHNFVNSAGSALKRFADFVGHTFQGVADVVKGIAKVASGNIAGGSIDIKHGIDQLTTQWQNVTAFTTALGKQSEALTQSFVQKFTVFYSALKGPILAPSQHEAEQVKRFSNAPGWAVGSTATEHPEFPNVPITGRNAQQPEKPAPQLPAAPWKPLHVSQDDHRTTTVNNFDNRRFTSNSNNTTNHTTNDNSHHVTVQQPAGRRRPAQQPKPKPKPAAATPDPNAAALEKATRAAQRERAEHERSLNESAENLRVRDETQKLDGQTPKQAAKNALDNALLVEERARAVAHEAQEILDAARQFKGDVTAAEDHLADANAELKRAWDDVGLRDKAYANALNAPEKEAKQQPNILASLVQKLGIPGLGVNPPDKSGKFGGFSFSWQTFVIEAASKTKSFGDIMKVVNEVMGVFVQILDAGRPIIDLLLKVVGFLVNGFIDLWNVIARILRIFGIHIALLEKINTNFDQLNNNTVPLISITHDIPTMNELASGKVGPLSPTPINSNSVSAITTPTVDAIKSPDMGGGILGKLIEILGAVLALKTVMRWFGGGGGGGILGGIANIAGNFGLKFGSGTNGTALLGDLGIVAGGAALGGLIGQSVFGGGSHTDWGAVGGAAGILGVGAYAGSISAALGGAGGIGGGLAALASGPAGWAVLAGAALLGGLAGGVFGHKDNPVAMPDKYATQEYGQALADFQGQSGDINGSRFSESGDVSKALGGKSEATYISDWIKNNAAEAAKILSPEQIKAFSGNAGVTNLHEGYLTLANGTRMFWSDLFNDARDAITKIGKEFQNALDPNAMGNIGDKAQAITQGVSDAGNELAGRVREATCPGNATDQIGQMLAQIVAQQQNGGGGDMPITIHQNITHTGDINGADDVDDLAEWHGAAAERAIRNRTYLLNRAWSPT
jgi:hypothetical protein